MSASTFLLLTLLPLAEPLKVQCPPGYGAVLEGATLVCRPLPTTPSVNRLKPPAASVPPPAAAPAPTSSAGSDLRGLHSIPEICGLNREEDETVEQVAEAVHIAVAECAAEIGAAPSLAPVRWLVFRAEALSETTHEYQSPPEAWQLKMDACLARHPPRLPRAVRGKSFAAWYLMQERASDRPSSPACVGLR